MKAPGWPDPVLVEVKATWHCANIAGIEAAARRHYETAGLAAPFVTTFAATGEMSDGVIDLARSIARRSELLASDVLGVVACAAARGMHALSAASAGGHGFV